MMKKRWNSVISELFQSYRKDIYNFLRVRLGREEGAEDLTQETFLRAHRQHSWDDSENPKAYLYRIADNLFKDALRKEKRQPDETSFVDITVLDMDSGGPSPERVAYVREQFKGLNDAIEQLTPQVRRAFVMHKLMNLSYAEIGEEMGISLSTVEKHIAKGTSQCLAYVRQMDEPIAQDIKNNVVTLQRRPGPVSPSGRDLS